MDSQDDYGLQDIDDSNIDALFPPSDPMPLEEPVETAGTSTSTSAPGGKKRRLTGDEEEEPSKAQKIGFEDDDLLDIGELTLSSNVFTSANSVPFENLSRGEKAVSYISDYTQDVDFVYQMFDLILQAKELGVKTEIFKSVITKYELTDISKEEVERGLSFRGTRDLLESKVKKEVQSALVYFTGSNIFALLKAVAKQIGQIEESRSTKSVKVHFVDNASPLVVKLENLLNSEPCFLFNSVKNTFTKGHVLNEISPLILRSYLFSGLRPMTFKQVTGKEFNEQVSFRFDTPSKLTFDLGPAGSIPTPSGLVAGSLLNAVTEYSVKSHFHNKFLEVGVLGPFYLLACFKRVFDDANGQNMLTGLLNAYENNVLASLQTLCVERDIPFNQNVLIGKYTEIQKSADGINCVKQYVSFFGTIGIELKQALFKFFALTKVICDIIYLCLINSGLYDVAGRDVNMQIYFEKAFKSNTLPQDRVLQIAQRLNQHRAIMKLDDISLGAHYEMTPDPHVRKVKGAMSLEHVCIFDKHAPKDSIRYNFASKQIMDFVRLEFLKGTTFYLADDSDPDKNILGTTERSHFNRVIYDLVEDSCTPSNLNKKVVVSVIGTGLKMAKISMILNAFAGIKERVEINLAVEPYQFGQDEDNFFIKTQFNDSYPSTFNFKIAIEDGDQSPVRWFKMTYKIPGKFQAGLSQAQKREAYRDIYNGVNRDFYKPMFDYVTKDLNLTFMHNLGYDVPMSVNQLKVISRALVLLKPDAIVKDAERMSNIEQEKSMKEIFFKKDDSL